MKYGAALLASLLLVPSLALAQPLYPQLGPGAASSSGSGLTIGTTPIGGVCTNGYVLYYNAGVLACEAVSGTVTTVSVASANGLAGTVANATTTPVITLSTSVTGLLKGNGTAISAATPGTDYLAPTGSGAALTGLTWSQIGSTPTTVAGYGITNAATNGANSNITSLTGLTTPLSVAQGGTGGADANIAYLDVAQSFTKPQRGNTETPAISSTTFTPVFSTGQNHRIAFPATTCACTIANPAALVAGQSGMFELVQGATSASLNPTWGSEDQVLRTYHVDRS